VSFVAVAGIGNVLIWVFWIAVVFGVIRSLFVLSLAHLRRRHPSSLPEPARSVTIVIPAFNEELVIADGIAAALASNYPDVRIIVVDDGSTDSTALAVEAAFGNHPSVRLIRQPNGGKCKALNAAYAEIETEVVVAVDADTLLHPDAVRMLLGHFSDPQIGAVAGNVKVGNRRGLLPRLQALEYITAQNIDRRAAEHLNAMLVVPGAIGAWRAEVVRKVGLYSSDTITEDADLTIAILRAGYRVVFEERAYSITDAPETLSSFMKQRLRWTFGMMQATWKHRRAAKTARGVVFFSIPDLWLTGILLGLLAPLADAMFAGALIKAAAGVAQGEPLANTDTSIAIVIGWVALPVLDLVLVLAAFRFERQESRWLIFLVPFQRLIYRPLLYITVYRAVSHALAGRIAGWGKLIRLGKIRKPAR
jgi:cellulose synthase/poly-beta-1,6-N-acetylglucosamine synthase-like glycosyltransferase